MSRLFAIGDIHGCLDLLNSLLDAIAPTSTDCIIFLGDMVDRGSNSKGVIDRIMQLSEHCQVISLMGNHEEMMQQSMTEVDICQAWIRCGGSETLQSFELPITFEGAKDIPLTYEQWLDGLLPYHETQDFIFCHATPHPDKSMSEQGSAVRWRKLNVYDLPHVSGKTIICGHSEQCGGDIWQQPSLICIDTFAYGGGGLTALEIINRQTMRTWQVGFDREVKIKAVYPFELSSN